MARASCLRKKKKGTTLLPSPLYGERVADAVGRASRLPEREARKPGEGFNMDKKSKQNFGFLLLNKPLTRFLPALRYGRNHPLPVKGRG